MLAFDWEGPPAGSGFDCKITRSIRHLGLASWKIFVRMHILQILPCETTVSSPLQAFEVVRKRPQFYLPILGPIHHPWQPPKSTYLSCPLVTISVKAINLTLALRPSHLRSHGTVWEVSEPAPKPKNRFHRGFRPYQAADLGLGLRITVLVDV